MAGRVVDDDMRWYYDKRAAEYDDWWLGTGLFAERDRPDWSAGAAELGGATVLHSGRWFVAVAA